MAEHSPTPWRLELDEAWPEFTDCPIRDANGDPVVQTDSGVYPPDNATAALIVEAVNAYDRLRKELRAARTNAGSEKRWWANHYFERAQAAEAERDALNEVAANLQKSRANIIADNDRLRDLVRRLAEQLAVITDVFNENVACGDEARWDGAIRQVWNGSDPRALLREAREAIGEEGAE